MRNLVISSIVGSVLPKKGVRNLGSHIEFTLKNPLPKITIKDFQINQIDEHADIFINNKKLELKDFEDVSIIINHDEYKLRDLENQNVIIIPHKPHSKILIPIELCKESQIKIDLLIKIKNPIEISLERKVY